MRALIALFSLATLSGCGKFLENFSRLPGGFTKVVFNRDSQGARDLRLGLLGPGMVHANSVLNGGAIIYAQNAQNGRTYSGTVQNEGGTLSLTLPNGDYAFSAVGWPDANLADQSTNYIRCGTAPALTLTGLSQDITFNLADKGACATSPGFAVGAILNSGTPSTIGTLMLDFCHQSTSLISKGQADYCQGVDLSSNFYAGNATTAKIDKVSYFSSPDTFLFTASHDSYQSTQSVPPNAPYELFRFDHSSGKQTKIPLALSGGYGVVNPKQPYNHNKLLFLIRNASGPATLWSYNLSNGAFVQVSQNPTSGTTTGVKEFRLSDDGNWVVFAGDMDTNNVDELYSVPVPSDSVATFSAPTKISGTLISGGVAHCLTSCGGDHNYFFDISRGTSSPYVAFAGITSAPLTPLFFASMDGTPIPSTTIAGTGGTNTPSGTPISGSEISVSTDYIDSIAFNSNGQYLIYRAHSGAYDKAMTVQVNYVPGTSLTVTAPVQIMQGLTQPFFVTGASTTKAILFSGANPGGNNTSITVSVVDLTAPSTTLYSLFTESSASGLDVSSNQLTQSDNTFVVAFQDHTSSKAVDLVSVSTISTSNFSTTPFSYTGGVLTSQQIKPINGSGGGNNFFRLAPGATFGLLFISDKATTNTFQLWSASLASAPVDSSGTSISSTVPVVSATYASNGSIYFAAPIVNASTNELYLANPGSQPSQIGSTAYFGSINSLGDSDGAAGLGQILPINASPLSATQIQQPYLYHVNTGTFEGIGRIGAQSTGTSPSGVGRVRIAMLQSNDGINFGTAFDSGCLSFTGATQDGQHLFTNVRIPTGPGSSSPFATEIDVYPLALDCTGTPQRHLLPNGIGTALDQVSSGVLLRASSGTGKLFIQDL